LKANTINTPFENSALPNKTLHTELTASNEDLALAEQKTLNLNLATAKSHLWQLPRRGDRVIQIRISRNTLISFVFSILIHLLLLITLAPKLLDMGGSTAKQDQSFDVQLSLPAPRVAETPAVSAPAAPTIKPQPIQKSRKQKLDLPTPNPKPKTNTPLSPEVMTADKPHSPLTKPPMTPALTHNAPATSTEPLPGEDMQAYIKRQKEQRQAAQGYTQKDSDEINTRDNSPVSDEDKRTAAIQRNLQPQGGNGIFQIREISLRTGRFSFKGWKNDYSKAKQRDFDIEVPLGGDIQRAMVKKMIAIIREEYTGDFNWDSQRLGRVITLSAKPADNAGLEDFLIEEFFGRSGLAPR
jgi:hypothetical protein